MNIEEEEIISHFKKKYKKNSVFNWALLNTLLLFWRNVKKGLFHIHALRIFTNSEFISQKIRWYCPARWFFNKKHCKFVSSLALFFSCFTAKEEAIITNCPLSMRFFSRPLIGPQITWPGGGKKKSHNLFKFVFVLLSVSVERVGVSRIRDF